MPLADFPTGIGMQLFVNTLYPSLYFNNASVKTQLYVQIKSISPFPLICEAAIRSCFPLAGIFSFLKDEVIFKTSLFLLKFSKLEIFESFSTAKGDLKHSCLKSQDNNRNKIIQQTEREGKVTVFKILKET